MPYEALATDYDGTLASDGIVDQATLAALRRAREAGLRLVLVTGRQLDDLLTAFAGAKLFDLIVAENGALLYTPSSAAERLLAPPPPPEFLRALHTRQVPVWAGRCIVATVVPHDAAMAEVIHELGLEWHVILNKKSVMALPANVDKWTGLAAALDTLGIRPARTVAVGDAENDEVFLRSCGFAAAVANALPVVKASADFVTTGARGAGVIELIDRILTNGTPDGGPADPS